MFKFFALFGVVSSISLSLFARSAVGKYNSIDGKELRYHVTYASAPQYQNRLFVYIRGDGDTCGTPNSYYEKITSSGLWEATTQILSSTGNWVIPETLTDYNCLYNPNRLDGMDYYHRVDETELLVKKIETDFPNVTEIYLMGHSAGPRLAGLSSIRLNDDPKVKGVIFHTGLYTHFQTYFKDWLTARAPEENVGEQELNSALSRIDDAFAEVRQCDPTKKSIAGHLWYKYTPQTPETLEGYRTDDYWCQWNEENFLDRFYDLNSNRKYLVITPTDDPITPPKPSDPTKLPALAEFLKQNGFDFQHEYYEEMTHNWTETRFVEKFRDHILSWLQKSP
jgi:hypothetical protein